MSDQVTFKRNIGLFMAVMIGIGAMMGPGIFALPGELAHMVGPLGIFAYLAMGFLTMFTALNYSELGAAIPLAGGGYSFTSRTLQAGGISYRLVFLDWKHRCLCHVCAYFCAYYPGLFLANSQSCFTGLHNHGCVCRH